jgi:hypothetical protein
MGKEEIIILDYDKPPAPIKVKKKKVFNQNDYRTIVQNRVKYHKKKKSPPEVIEELNELLNAISCFGKPVINIPRYVIDIILDTLELTYNEVFNLSKTNGYSQKRVHSQARKYIAFFLYRYTKMSQALIGENYLACAFPGRVSAIIKEVFDQLTDEETGRTIREIDDNISNYLTARFPSKKSKILAE